MARENRIGFSLTALICLGAAPALPRIVSLNPCLDAILVRVADSVQIAAISDYSLDPRSTSIPLALARRFRATSGTAEEAVALRPDLVVAGGHVSPATIAALARLKVRLVQYPVPVTVAESEAQVRALAATVGHPDRGAALAVAIDAAARPQAGARVPALILSGGGLVPGMGTLPDDLLTRAGFANASAGYGLAQWGVLPLERLIAAPPRVLFSTGRADGPGDRLMTHPALARLARRIAVAPFPSRFLTCGGPSIVPAMAQLRAARRRVG